MASLPDADRLALLHTLEKPVPAKAKLPLHELENGGQLLRLAITRSGCSLKEAAYWFDVDPSQFTRMLDGKEKIWFFVLVEKLPPEVWRELLIVLAQRVCGGKYTVKRSVTIEEVS